MLNTASHTFSAIFLLAHTNNKYNYAYLRLEGSRCRVAKIGPCRRIAIFDPFAISSHHDNRPRFQGPHKFRTVIGPIPLLLRLDTSGHALALRGLTRTFLGGRASCARLTCVGLAVP